MFVVIACFWCLLMQSLHSNISPLFACKGGKNPKSLGKALQKYRGQVSGSTSKNPLERITRPYITSEISMQFTARSQNPNMEMTLTSGNRPPSILSIGLLPPMRCCPGGWGRCQLDHLFRWVLWRATKGHVEVPEKTQGSLQTKLQIQHIQRITMKRYIKHTGVFTILYKPCIDKYDTCMYVYIYIL